MRIHTKNLIMRKLFILFYFFPLFAFSQTNLVKWFKSDLSPTLLEENISSGLVSGVIHKEYGSQDPFYTTNNNFSSSATLDSRKFVQFKISANNGYRIKLSDFSFSARNQGGNDGQKFQIWFSKDAGFSTSQILMGETNTNASYISYKPTFPANTFVESGESMYLRIYVYHTNNNFHIRHNQTGSIAPVLSGKVSLTNPVKPVSNDDRTGTFKNTSVNIDVLGNDEYRFSGDLIAINTLKPSHGTVVVNGLNSISYTPDSNYIGYDSFYYTLTNSAGVSNMAKVEIQVIEGAEKVLVRWNQTDKSAKNYTVDVAGSELNVVGETIQINSNEVMAPGRKAFMVDNLPNPQEFDGKLDPSRYLSFSLATQNTESFAFLNALKLSYRSRGTGNMTIKCSKTPDFKESVYTIVDDISYNTNWTVKDFNLPSGLYLFPGEKMYFRIYTYNTNNAFFIDFIENGEGGPAISGITTVYAPEPCSTSVIWDGTKWSGTPNINRKAILNAAYSTATNGSFEACNLIVNSGKLTINPAFPVKVQNEIKVNTGANVEIQSGANLVQVNDLVPANEGIVNVLQEIKIGKARNQYNYLGSPVVFSGTESFKTIYPGVTSVLSYNESNNLFNNFTGTPPAGKGLALKEPTLAKIPLEFTSVIATYKGTPQNGIYTYSLGNSNTATNNGFGYNLVANPYPSNIDISELYKANRGVASNPNLSATFYFWDNGVNNDIAQSQQGSSYSGQAYAVFNALAGKNGTGTSAAGYLNNNVIGKKRPTNIVAVGQGFLVRALAKNYALKFNNGIRTSTEPEVKFLGKSENTKEDDRYWVKMISPANLTSSAAVIYFEDGNEGVGEEDSKARGASDEIFTFVEDQKLSINGKPGFQISDRVALGTNHFASGTYAITIEEKEGVFASGQKIYLKDKQTGIITNISEGSYSFDVVAGETSDRFEIIYQPQSVLTTGDPTKDNLTVYRTGNDFVVKSQSNKITKLEVYDVSGRLAFKLQPNQTKVTIPAETLTNGIYIIKIHQGGQITSKKIIK